MLACASRLDHTKSPRHHATNPQTPPQTLTPVRRATLEALKALRIDADVIHLHEWQCSAAAMLYWDVFYAAGDFRKARLVLTIHNMDNSGECRQDEFAVTGVAGASIHTRRHGARSMLARSSHLAVHACGVIRSAQLVHCRPCAATKANVLTRCR
jgi:hypothetical protein